MFSFILLIMSISHKCLITAHHSIHNSRPTARAASTASVQFCSVSRLGDELVSSQRMTHGVTGSNSERAIFIALRLYYPTFEVTSAVIHFCYVASKILTLIEGGGF